MLRSRPPAPAPYWSFELPSTSLGVSRTVPVLPLTVRLPAIALPVTVVPPPLFCAFSDEYTVLPTASTPAVLPLSMTVPCRPLDGHDSVPSPTTTEPVPLAAFNAPLRVAPQMRSSAAPFAFTGPDTVAPSMSSAPPDLTVTAPPTLAVGASLTA